MLQGIIESTDAGILAIDNNGNVCNYNQKFVQMWGLSEAVDLSRSTASPIDKPIATGFPFPSEQLKHPQEFIENAIQIPKSTTYY